MRYLSIHFVSVSAYKEIQEQFGTWYYKSLFFSSLHLLGFSRNIFLLVSTLLHCELSCLFHHDIPSSHLDIPSPLHLHHRSSRVFRLHNYFGSFFRPIYYQLLKGMEKNCRLPACLVPTSVSIPKNWYISVIYYQVLKGMEKICRLPGTNFCSYPKNW